MDWVRIRDRGWEFLKKYRYVALVLLAGLILMLLPEGGEDRKEEQSRTVEIQETQPTCLQDSLEDILSQIEGAGKVQVLLTEAAGERTVYQTDEDISTNAETSSVRRETVILSGADRAENGLVQQVNPPTYLGAIVVCQGADRAAIRLAVVEAVAKATGLTSDKITVLKMK